MTATGPRMGMEYTYQFSNIIVYKQYIAGLAVNYVISNTIVLEIP